MREWEPNQDFLKSVGCMARAVPLNEHDGGRVVRTLGRSCLIKAHEDHDWVMKCLGLSNHAEYMKNLLARCTKELVIVSHG